MNNTAGYLVIADDGTQYGPISEAELRNWIRDGRVHGGTQAWQNGMAEWKPLSQIPAFRSVLATPPPPPRGAAQSPNQKKSVNRALVIGLGCLAVVAVAVVGIMAFMGGDSENQPESRAQASVPAEPPVESARQAPPKKVEESKPPVAQATPSAEAPDEVSTGTRVSTRKTVETDPATGLPVEVTPRVSTRKNRQMRENVESDNNGSSASRARSLPLEWNKQEIQALENGNIQVAVQTLKAKPDARTGASAPEPQLVAKAPWNYYGKPVKFSAVVDLVQDYPPGSDIAKGLGGEEASEIIMECQDGTIVDMFCTKSSGAIKVGTPVTLYGYVCGIMEVPNKIGGKFTHLVLVGNDYDIRGRAGR